MLIDEQDRVFVIWSGVTSLRDQDNYMYRHLYARASIDNGQTWEDDIADLTGDIVFTGMECVYPTLSSTSTDELFLMFQQDEYAGIYIFGGQGQEIITNNEMVILDPSKESIIYPVGISNLQSPIPDFRMTNYPNPFSSSTTIEFNIEQPGNVEITIYNQFGKSVDKFTHHGQKGLNRITWDAGELPAGVYVCRITTGSKTASKKLVLVR